MRRVRRGIQWHKIYKDYFQFLSMKCAICSLLSFLLIESPRGGSLCGESHCGDPHYYSRELRGCMISCFYLSINAIGLDRLKISLYDFFLF